MIEQVFTFGYGHTCPYTRRSLADHYVTVVAESRDQARRLMVRLFNDRWAFQYDALPDALPDGFPMVEHARITLDGPR